MSAPQTGDDPDQVKSRPEGEATSCALGPSGRPGSTDPGSSPFRSVVEGVVEASDLLGPLAAVRVVREVCTALDADAWATDTAARAAAGEAVAAAESEVRAHLDLREARAEAADRDFARVLVETHPAATVESLAGLLDALAGCTVPQLAGMALQTEKSVRRLPDDHWLTPYHRATHGILGAVLTARTGSGIPPLPPLGVKGTRRG